MKNNGQKDEKKQRKYNVIKKIAETLQKHGPCTLSVISTLTGLDNETISKNLYKNRKNPAGFDIRTSGAGRNKTFALHGNTTDQNAPIIYTRKLPEKDEYQVIAHVKNKSDMAWILEEMEKILKNKP
ncbi:hypothetical protein [Acidithiobacillus thiooxidans]|uniref:hypothetical protein n=1 Tax=Acidithiobacillus thiooxidans TaxID=930 RepID=UPI0004E1E4E8|nr:hypothetical protein [Acidithiobacillus thiooxidans]